VTDHAFWHPFADMGAVASAPFEVVRGEGVHVWDADGRRYLDASAALWYANLGHGRPEIADAVAEQLRTLDAYSTFGDFSNPQAARLAERLADLAPQPGSKVFFGSGGGDAIDTAAKIARAHHLHRGRPERTHLISREHGYHGTHGVGTGIAGIPANAAHFGALVPDASVVAYDDADALEAEILRVGPERVAAFFCEPVIGAGGVLPPPEGYIERVAEICRRHGVLFVADCVIAGFGRLGTWLGIDRWAVQPDLVTLAKGITGGTLPLGAVIVAPDVAAPFFTGEPGAPILRHGATYAGHPACCAAANAALDLYVRDDVIRRGRDLERPLLDALAPLADDPLVGEVRGGVGLMAAAEVAPDALAADPGIVAAWQAATREAGVLTRGLGKGLAVSPPLTITEDEIAQIGEAMATGLAAASRRVAGGARA
jgi:adenosylmethionine-8-amino-7-oxononanoate aminotransferase